MGLNESDYAAIVLVREEERNVYPDRCLHSSCELMCLSRLIESVDLGLGSVAQSSWLVLLFCMLELDRADDSFNAISLSLIIIIIIIIRVKQRVCVLFFLSVVTPRS